MTDSEGTPPATPVPPGGGPPADGVVEIDVASDADPAAAPGDVPLPSGGPAPAPSPWRSVILTPLRGGTLLGTCALALLAACGAWLEGGSTAEAHLYRQLGQAIVGMASVAVLSVYARRIVLCTAEGDRPVPWFTDAHDDATTWKLDLASFLAVLLSALAPALFVNTAALVTGAPRALTGFAVFVGLVAGALHFPFAALSVVLRNGPLGAWYAGSLRAWRSHAAVARTAVLPALAFLGLTVLASVLGGWLVPAPYDEWSRPIADHTTGRDLARAAVFGLELAALLAALCTFRVAGLLARDVPEIREVLQ